MHIMSSAAEFWIRNPLLHNKITIRTLDGAARYNGTVLGTIYYAHEFIVKSGKDGSTLSPRLPVVWSLDGVGFDTVRKALGGTLEVHAEANCVLSIGDLVLGVLYNSSNPIGAHIRF